MNYVENKGVSIGSSKAYSQNIDTLNNYIQSIIDSEVVAVQKIIKDLQVYQQNFWAIGLNGDTLQPDGFNNFFVARKIEFKPFVRKNGVSIGEESAYERNISAMEKYISELKKHSTAVAV